MMDIKIPYSYYCTLLGKCFENQLLPKGYLVFVRLQRNLVDCSELYDQLMSLT